MQTTTGHLSSMYTTVGNYRDVTVALIFFRGVGDARASACRRLDSAHSFLCAFLSVWFYYIYIYIFFINTHRCKTHTRGRISTHVPVSCFFFYVSLYLDVVWLHATRFLVLSLAKISLSKRVCGPTFLPCFLARFFSAPRSNEAFDRSTQQPIL